MHEMSLAEALLTHVQRRVPEGATLRNVTIEAGAALALEPTAMQFAWQALTLDTALAGSALNIDILPWELHCHECGRIWPSDDPLALCACGAAATHPVGDSRLRLLSLDVETDATFAAGCATIASGGLSPCPEDVP